MKTYYVLAVAILVLSAVYANSTNDRKLKHTAITINLSDFSVLENSIGMSTNVTQKYATVSSEDEDLFKEIEAATKLHGISTHELLRTDGYQYKSFEWLAENRDILEFDPTLMFQRYALACLWYSTYQVATVYNPEPQDWNRYNLWMTYSTVCLWEGIECDPDTGMVRSILLEENNLSGKLPPELSFLGNLRTLDFTRNHIHMNKEDMNFLNKLSNLRKLDIDDNFFSFASGLPYSFSSLTKLEHLKASYNLMTGPLDNGVLQKLTKLTHLEIESNFFTGALHFLGDM